jgi:hypothetical protein
MNVGHFSTWLSLANVDSKTRLCLSILPNACQAHHLILQAQLRSNTNIMDRSLDRSLDDILGDRKQVRQTSPRSLSYRPIGIMPAVG